MIFFGKTEDLKEVETFFKTLLLLEQTATSDYSNDLLTYNQYSYLILEIKGARKKLFKNNICTLSRNQILASKISVLIKIKENLAIRNKDHKRNKAND